MPNVTVTPPQTITVKVGPASPPTVTAISYGGGGSGGGGGVFAIKDAVDIDMTTAVNGGSIVFNAITNSFFVKTPNIDNGFF
jgi:hypothetical protein